MANTRTIATSNEALAKVKAQVQELIGWAEADAQHAAENDAAFTSADDKRRAKLLKQALKLLEQCER